MTTTVKEANMAKKHKFTHTHIDLHDDGSATIHHMHADGPEKDVKYAASDLDGVHDGMEDHLNHEESGKEEALEEKISPGIHAKVASMSGKEE